MTEVIMIRSHFPDSRLEKEATTLANSNYKITLIVWDRGRISGNKNKNDFTIEKFSQNVLPNDIAFILYLPAWWLFILIKLLTKKWDIVHAADFDTLIPALLSSKIKRKIVIYDIYDFYADMIKFPIFPAFFRKFISRVDKELMKFIDIIIIPDESRRDQINPKKEVKIEVINNSPREEIPGKLFINNGQITKNFKLFFGGQVGEDRGIDIICSAVKELDNVETTIMGPCAEIYKKKLETYSKNDNRINLILKYTPHNQIIEYTINSDLIFAFYDPKIPNNRYASPNKLFEAMLCGKPILTNNGTSMAEIVKRENCGLIVPYGDSGAIKEAILTLKNDSELCKQLGKNARAAYVNKYDWKLMELKLLNIYNLLINKKG